MREGKAAIAADEAAGRMEAQFENRPTGVSDPGGPVFGVVWSPALAVCEGNSLPFLFFGLYGGSPVDELHLSLRFRGNAREGLVASGHVRRV